MPVKIKVAGKSEDKPAARKTRSTAKPAASKRSTKRQGTAPAAKRGAARTRTTTRPAKSNGEGPVRRASKNIDPRTEARLLKAVEKAGDRRRKAEIEHKESINALHDEARLAIEGGVSMAKVADASGISRQWLYKMGDFADREGVTNGSGSKTAAKTATKRTTRTAPAKRTAAASKPAASRRRAPAKPAASKPTPRRRVSIRS
jgi:hypothetical protein